MKALFISDIHGIYQNLEYIENIIKKEKIEKLIVLGDLYYCGPTYSYIYEVNSQKVKDFLTKHRDILICMKGNCDSDVDLKVSDFPICNNLSLLYIDNINIYITHGNEYNQEKNSKFNSKDVLVYGHEHIPYIKKNNDMIYINVGSISLPRNNNKPTYMIYENKTFTIYNIDEQVVDKIKI